MTTCNGILHKMQTEYAQPVNYYLQLENQKVSLNDLLGQTIQLKFTGSIYCIQCNRKTSKSFQQGHCYPCYRRLWECNLCLIHPQNCGYYQGHCDPNDWAHAHCTTSHIVYLANSSQLKVGITRCSHIPTRWIDQGATQGLPLFQVNNRRQAGLVEMALKQFIADKTRWQQMLKVCSIRNDMLQKKAEILNAATSTLDEIQQQFPGEIESLSNQEITSITYPLLQYPQKITTLNFEKNPLITGLLQGIKGQYILLDTGVLSIRKFAGYHIQFDY